MINSDLCLSNMHVTNKMKPWTWKKHFILFWTFVYHERKDHLSPPSAPPSPPPPPEFQSPEPPPVPPEPSLERAERRESWKRSPVKEAGPERLKGRVENLLLLKGSEDEEHLGNWRWRRVGSEMGWRQMGPWLNAKHADAPYAIVAADLALWV